jgi:hypothetical protein
VLDLRKRWQNVMRNSCSRAVEELPRHTRCPLLALPRWTSGNVEDDAETTTTNEGAEALAASGAM